MDPLKMDIVSLERVLVPLERDIVTLERVL
jgi:hypothetical protein